MLWCSFIEYAYSNLPLQMVKNIPLVISPYQVLIEDTL